MLGHAFADDLSLGDIECGEQRGRAIALVAMGHRFTVPLLDRKSRLGPVLRLDLALLVAGHDDGMLERTQIESDDIFEVLLATLVF